MTFTVYPAIDLRQGQVVRLKQGDPSRQTVYGREPAATARRWLEAGARWLHVVNLDGAFGERDAANQSALAAILQTAQSYDAYVQFGGGLRSMQSLEQILELGVERAILGTVAAEKPDLLKQALQRFGGEHIAAGIDARNGKVQIRGWAQAAQISALDLARRMAVLGVSWVIFTDVSRDGVGRGLNIPATQTMAKIPGLRLIASGGVDGPEDVRTAKQAGFAGVIVGRALYEGKLEFGKW
jgi:phosphoribosylformimino-5-aminoimidazole carboxamide ribotide isomerase